MKVAILHYGQPRFAISPDVVNSKLKYLIDIYDCDIYGHMWLSQEYLQGAKWNTSYEKTNLQPMYNQNVKQDFYNCFKSVVNIKFEYQKQSMYFLNMFSNNDKVRLIKRFPKESPHINSDLQKKMYFINNQFCQMYSIQQSARNFLNHKICDYDFIILMRYDLVLFKKLIINPLEARIQHPDIWDAKRLSGMENVKWSFRDNFIVYKENHIQLILKDIFDTYLKNIEKFFVYCNRIEPQVIHGFMYHLFFENIEENVCSMNFPYDISWGIKNLNC